MPLYEYRCRDCGHRFEILQRLGQGAEGLACPRCGADQLDKQYSTFASNAGETVQRSVSPSGACSGFT
jgi:putative FmdB family regulatory protein